MTWFEIFRIDTLTCLYFGLIISVVLIVCLSKRTLDIEKCYDEAFECVNRVRTVCDDLIKKMEE